MSRSPGLIALTRRRVATPRSAAVVIVALTLLAAFLISAAPRALSGVVREEVAFQIDQLSTPARDLTATVRNVPPYFGPSSDPAVTEGWPSGADEVFGALARRLEGIRSDASPAVQAITEPASFYAYTEAAEVNPEVLPSTSPTGIVQLIGDPAYQEHLTLVEGEWPAPWRRDSGQPLEIVLTRDAAELIVWSVGEHRGGVAESGVVLIGLVEPTQPGDDRWAHHIPSVVTGTYFDDGNRRPSATGGAYVDPGSWPEVGHLLMEMTIWYPLDAQAASEQDPDELLAGLREVTAQSLSLGGDFDTRARFGTDVTSVLSMSLQRANSTSATLAVAAVGPIAVSVALIVLAASLIIRRRRGDLLLLSARGTSLARLRGLLLLEGLLLGLVPAAVAATAALLLVPTSAGILPTVLAVAVGLVPAAALALVLRPQTLAGGRADLDAPRRSRWARLVELLILVLAGLAVGLLVFRGVGRASAGVDPLVVVAPLLATVALGLLAVRLHPLWLAAVLRGAQRGKDLVSLVGSARSLRDPAAGTTAVLAMLVAVAIAVFSSLILATVDRGAVVAAERSIGGDLHVSGPFFDEEVIEAIADLDGVEHVTGFFVADRVPVTTAQGRVVAALLVTDVAELEAVQAGLGEGMPRGALGAGQEPPQVLASPDVVSAVGTGAASEPFGEVAIVGEIATLPGAAAGASFIVMDRADYIAASGKGFFPRTLVIDLAPDADAETVSEAVTAQIDTAHVVQSLQARTAAIQSSPAVSALRTALLIALVLAVVLSVVAILLVAGVSRDARSRVIALLRTMGMSRRQGRGVVAWEFAPLGLSALVGGLALGVVLPLLVLISIDLRPFTGGIRQPGLTVDPVLTASLIAAVVIALIIAVVGGVLTARTTSLVTVLRTEEDR